MFSGIFDDVSYVSVKESPYGNVIYSVEDNSLKVNGGMRGRVYSVILTVGNAAGSVDMEIKIVEGGYGSSVLIPHLESPSIDVYVEHSTTMIDLSVLKIGREYKIMTNVYDDDDNLDILGNVLYVEDNYRGSYDCLVDVDGDGYVLRIHERVPRSLNEYMLVNYRFDRDMPDSGKYMESSTYNVNKIRQLERTVPPIAKGDMDVVLEDKELVYDLSELIRGYIIDFKFIQDNLFNNAKIEDNKLKIIPNGRDEEYDIILRAENDFGVAITNISVDERNVKRTEDSLRVWYSFDGEKKFSNYS